MLELISKYCLDKTKNTGLLLLDMPTGTGKTFNVLQFIKQYLKKNQDKKIFFVTSLIKNVDDPYEELLDDLDKDDELRDLVFRALSNKDSAIENFEKVKENIKDKDIRYSEEYKKFEALIMAGVKNPEAYVDIERDFRGLISKTLSRKFKKKIDKINAIKNDKSWQWVGDLYPAVFSEEKSVFFVTMKKLVLPFDTIIEKGVRLYETSFFKNSIVFIDEFDATKKEIQDVIVQNGLNNGIDYIDLFRNIKICLDNQESIPSNIWDNVKNKPSHKRALEKNIRIFNEISDKYHLLQHHKSVGFEEKRIVLFSDLTHNNYTTSEENVTTRFIKNENINTLELISKGESDTTLYEALDKIKGAISHFKQFVCILAYSYYQNKNQKKEPGKSYGEFTELHALDTILDSLHLQGESYRVIRNMALSYNNTLKIQSNNAEIKDDFGFYSSGFSHYDFCDDYSHDNTTVIKKYVFEDTPESIMYSICSLSKVIGISATATFKTVLGNYDIDYLEWKLGDRFVKPTAEDKERIKKTIESQTTGFENVNTIVEFTETSANNAPDWANIYSDAEIANDAHLTTLCYGDTYKEVRYYKAVLAFKQFLDNNIQSYLALFSRGLRKGDWEFDQDKLFKLFKYLSQEKRVRFEDKMCVVLDSDNFEQKKKELIGDLSKGERRFIISTYATIGAGQNLQYPIPDCKKSEVIKINNDRKKEEMDIEGIYLDKPTSLVNLCGGNEESAINRIFQLEYLGHKREITPNEKMSEIKRTYINIDKERTTGTMKKLSNLRDVKIYATKIIVQAMGRKCRTNYRSKNVYVLADSELGDALDRTTLLEEDRLLNHEMVELAKKIKFSEEPSQSRVIEIAISDSLLTNKRISRFLTRCFENSWNNDEIKKWKNIREYVLKHPTLTMEEWEKRPFNCNYYITFGKPISKYFYKQSEDFDKIENIAEERFKDSASVSQEDVNLYNLLESIPNLKSFFLDNGYATEFREGDYIMSPPLYQNVYKGALGEAIGKFLFEGFGIPLEELNNEEHELFDYKVTGKPIYVDFKYWKDTTRFDAKEYHKKVVEKAKRCKEVRTVIIANVRDTKNDAITTTPENGFEIIELSLICNSQISHNALTKIQEFKNEQNTN
ncbi:MAG: DEAD/DEAH box helicase family protein [Salinivirgaceae bacterium]|nr:DEAD/DEAH box helicase family protein [Salinivirgaceae bacterium]